MLPQYGDQVISQPQCTEQDPAAAGDQCCRCWGWAIVSTDCRYGGSQGRDESVVLDAVRYEGYV